MKPGKTRWPLKFPLTPRFGGPSIQFEKKFQPHFMEICESRKVGTPST